MKYIKCILCITATISLVILFPGSIVQKGLFAQDNAKKVSKIIVVMDFEGRSTSVTDLKAVYTATGMWTSGPPTEMKPMLLMEWEVIEGRVSFTRKKTILFKDIRAIVFKKATLASSKKFPDGSIVEMHHNDSEMRIELKDSSFIRISPFGVYGVLECRIEERNQTFNVANFRLSTGEVQGQTMFLGRFEGRARVGRTDAGKFSIPLGEVQSIQFPDGT